MISIAKCLFFLASVGVLVSVVSETATAAQNPREKTVAIRSSGRTGTLFDLGLYYGQSEATANPTPGNEWKNITSVYDIKLGFIFDNDFYFGGGYMSRTDSLSSQSSSVSGGTAILGGGLFWGSGFNFRGYYHVNETWGDYKNGSGFQADLAYFLNMSSNFYMGLELSHRQTTFTQNSTVVGFQSWTRKETFPMVTVGFLLN